MKKQTLLTICDFNAKCKVQNDILRFAFCILYFALYFGIAALPAAADDQRLPRAIVADFVNASTDRHSVMVRMATDTAALELTRRDVYNVLARQEVDRVGKRLGLHAPYGEDDLAAIAKELDVALLVTGEIHHTEFRKNEVEVGLIVRVQDLALGEMINGAAERGIVPDPPDNRKPEGVLLMDAAAAAAVKAVATIRAYRPITGTLLNSQGHDIVILNRGLGHGVRKKQEFLVFRDGVRVGRLRVFKLYSDYTELTILESPGGIQPQDQAIAIFPEPKFGAK